jgi:hypothetical protein
MNRNNKPMRFFNRYFFAVVFFATGLAGCKKWEDHTAIGNQDLITDLSQAVAANASLSKFMQYVDAAGLDTLLRSSKTYTVWAPTDAAMATLDPSVVNDPVKLKSFLLNHISNLSYFTRDAQSTVRVAMLSGKYNSFVSNKFDDALITSADKFVRNGVLHVIDKIVPVLPSAWEYVNETATQYIQNAFIASLNYNDFDPELAIIDSISSTTGQPIYRPGTGFVEKNRFNEGVYNLKAEDKLYTYFVIANAGFTLEADSLKDYFKTPSTTSTDSLANWNTVRDLVVEGVHPVSALPGLVSKYGVSIPVNAGMIIETRKLSNGIVHVLTTLDINTKAKFKEITIEGENPSGFRELRTSNTSYRVRFNPVTNKDLMDILVSGHGISAYYSYYRRYEMPSMKYRVYGFAVNDFQNGNFTENIVAKFLEPPSTYTTLATLPYAVPQYTAAGAYNERLLGEITLANYGTLEIQLTSTGTNPIVLDYLRLVPVP